MRKVTQAQLPTSGPWPWIAGLFNYRFDLCIHNDPQISDHSGGLQHCHAHVLIRSAVDRRGHGAYNDQSISRSSDGWHSDDIAHIANSDDRALQESTLFQRGQFINLIGRSDQFCNEVRSVGHFSSRHLPQSPGLFPRQCTSSIESTSEECLTGPPGGCSRQSVARLLKQWRLPPVGL